MASVKQKKEGDFWADKSMDLANLSVVVLVFGQLVTDTINWPAIIIGIIFYLLITVLSMYLRRR